MNVSGDHADAGGGAASWLGMRLTVAPTPGVGPVLALGAYFKNAPCLLQHDRATFGAPLGDLDGPEACAALERVARILLESAGAPIAALAHDLHPDFHSSRVAVALAKRLGVPAVAVQHHHAHVEAVLAEHADADTCGAGVLGLALDGVGLGLDGSAWGGELLHVRGAHFERVGHLRRLPLPGGDRAAREPWRMAAAVLHAVGQGPTIATRFASQPAAALLAALLDRPQLCPQTSSLGRWFDAAAGLLGVCDVMRVEAEAAIALERLAAAHGDVQAQPGDWTLADGGVLDLMPVCAALADESDPARGAARFHAALVAGLEAWVLAAVARSGCHGIVFSGGCFHNRILSGRLAERLQHHGLNVLQARRLSPGDAGLALGQARVAARLLAGNAAEGPIESQQPVRVSASAPR